MLIELPYNAKVSVETRGHSILETTIEIEDNSNQCSNAILEAYLRSNIAADIETIESFFDRHEDDLQDWLQSKGYVLNKA